MAAKGEAVKKTVTKAVAKVEDLLAIVEKAVEVAEVLAPIAAAPKHERIMFARDALKRALADILLGAKALAERDEADKEG